MFTLVPVIAVLFLGTPGVKPFTNALAGSPTNEFVELQSVADNCAQEVIQSKKIVDDVELQARSATITEVGTAGQNSVDLFAHEMRGIVIMRILDRCVREKWYNTQRRIQPEVMMTVNGDVRIVLRPPGAD